jgi:Ca-activated chloride channel family protein
MTYFHTIRYADGVFEFHFPMVVGPRFNPPGYRDGVGAGTADAAGATGQKTEVPYLRPGELSAHDIALEVDIDAGLAIENPESPTHVVRVERPSPLRARVTLSPNDRIPNADFVLRYRVAGRGIRAALAAFRDDTGGYFTLLLHPPEKGDEVPRIPREMIFVLDCSGSMSGEPLALAKRSLERCLKRLGPDDTFQVVRFSDSASSMGSAPVPATPENVRRGLRYVEGLESEGGTMMIEGIRAALDFPQAPGRYRIVSFMTDGYIGNDREILGEVKRRLGAARVFSFGVGSSVNRYLLEGLARVGRGVCTVLTLDETAERAANELYERVERPALTDLRVDWGSMGISDVHPDPIPDLFPGRPIVLAGRFRGEGAATVRVTGRLAGRPYETVLEVNLSEPGLRHKALPAVWARAKIASVYDQMTWVTHPADLAPEIRRVALEYGLLSDFTAFVAVDTLSHTSGGHGTTVVQPVPVPKGVRYETTVSEK